MNTYKLTDTNGITWSIEGYDLADAIRIAKDSGMDIIEGEQALPVKPKAHIKKKVFRLDILDAKDRYWTWTTSAKSKEHALCLWAIANRASYKKARIINWKTI